MEIIWQSVQKTCIIRNILNINYGGFCLLFHLINHHFLHLSAPYDITQLPKLFGFIGGILLCIGTLGLFVLKLVADKEIVDKESVSMDYVFLFMLFIVSFSGLFLMVVRESAMLSYALWFHLSTILVFFLMIPYSKFVHIFYRFIALLKYNSEEVKWFVVVCNYINAIMWEIRNWYENRILLYNKNLNKVMVWSRKLISSQWLTYSVKSNI